MHLKRSNAFFFFLRFPVAHTFSEAFNKLGTAEENELQKYTGKRLCDIKNDNMMSKWLSYVTAAPDVACCSKQLE